MTGRAVLTLLLIGALFVVRWLVLRAVRIRVAQGSGYFRTKKWVAYIVTVLGAPWA
jgi:hypothetical protein